VGAALGTRRRDIQGTRVVERWAWELAVPAAAALLEASRLPDLRSARVRLEGGAAFTGTFHALSDDPEAHHPDAVIEPSEDALLALMHRAIADHVEPLACAVTDATARPLEALRRSTVDRVDAALVWVGQTSGRMERACALADRAGAKLVTIGEQRVHVRRGCCLYYRADAGIKCFGCPLLSDDDRRALTAAG
jgi:hypothetical protein